MIFLLDFQNPTNFYITLIFLPDIWQLIVFITLIQESFTFLCHQCINFTLITSTFEIQPFFPRQQL